MPPTNSPQHTHTQTQTQAYKPSVNLCVFSSFQILFIDLLLKSYKTTPDMSLI